MALIKIQINKVEHLAADNVENIDHVDRVDKIENVEQMTVIQEPTRPIAVLQITVGSPELREQPGG